MALGGLLLAAAVADYKDEQLALSAGNGRTKRFQIGDTDFENLTARNLKFSSNGGVVRVSAPSARTGSFSANGYTLKNVTGSSVQVTHRNGRTDVAAQNLASQTGQITNAKPSNVTADSVLFTSLPTSINILA